MFCRLLPGPFLPLSRTVKQLNSAADSLSGHRGPLSSSAGLMSPSSPCFSPPFSRLLLLSSGYEARRLTANREGLPWETEKGQRWGGLGEFQILK